MEKTREDAPDKVNDHLERRCPRLGGPVTFEYCRRNVGERLPCWKVFDCWWETFDVRAFFKIRLTAAEFQELVNTRPKPKVTSLLELIAQTQKNLSEET